MGAGLSGNNRKKQVRRVGVGVVQGMGVGDGPSRPSQPHSPVVLQRWGGPTDLSLGCPLHRPPTGPHPHTHRPHLKRAGQRSQEGSWGKGDLRMAATRKHLLQDTGTENSTLQTRIWRHPKRSCSKPQGSGLPTGCWKSSLPHPHRAIKKYNQSK